MRSPRTPDQPEFQGHPKQETPGQSPDPGFSMEPPVGFEPTTYALQAVRSCSGDVPRCPRLRLFAWSGRFADFGGPSGTVSDRALNETATETGLWAVGVKHRVQGRRGQQMCSPPELPTFDFALTGVRRACSAASRLAVPHPLSERCQVGGVGGLGLGPGGALTVDGSSPQLRSSVLQYAELYQQSPTCTYRERWPLEAPLDGCRSWRQGRLCWEGAYPTTRSICCRRPALATPITLAVLPQTLTGTYASD